MSAPDGPTTGYYVWRLSMKWRAACDRALAPLGLTQAKYSLLTPLHSLTKADRRPSQRQLAEFTGLEPIYVSKLARALENAGLIERTTHPHDPRAVRLATTDRGGEVAREAIEIVNDLHSELTAPIGGQGSARDRELREILRLLLGGAPPPDDSDSEETMS
jgi:DNA-binding MarR family transcriptional regulator